MIEDRNGHRCGVEYTSSNPHHVDVEITTPKFRLEDRTGERITDLEQRLALLEDWSQELTAWLAESAEIDSRNLKRTDERLKATEQMAQQMACVGRLLARLIGQIGIALTDKRNGQTNEGVTSD